MEALSSPIQRQLLGSPGLSPHSGDPPPRPEMGVQRSGSGTKQRWGAARDRAAPQTPLPAWLPLLRSIASIAGSHQVSPGLCISGAQGGSPACAAHGLVPLSPQADGTTATTRSSNPPKSVSSASLLPGTMHAPALRSSLPRETEVKPFDVPLPTPALLPAKNAGDFSLSLASDKSQTVPVALFEVAETSVWLRVPSLPGRTLGYVGNWPWAERCPQGPTVTVPRGCAVPRTQTRCSDSSCSPAGLTSAMGEPVQCVALVAEALEAARGVDAEVVAGAVERAFIDVCRKGKREVTAGKVEGQPWAQGLCPSSSACPSELEAAL